MREGREAAIATVLADGCDGLEPSTIQSVYYDWERNIQYSIGIRGPPIMGANYPPLPQSIM